MEHLSANNQKTLNVMSSLLKPFPSPLQGDINIEGLCFQSLASVKEITRKVVRCEIQLIERKPNVLWESQSARAI